MSHILEILFIVSASGILINYILYPISIKAISSFIKTKPKITLKEWPTVEVIFAAYNEQEVIQQKIESTFNSDYPKNKLSLRVGSDNSSDQTDPIIESLAQKYPNLTFKRFDERTGKSGILNQLVQESKADLLILTDANIIFKQDTISQLVNAIVSDNAGIVGGQIVYTEVTDKGISQQESSYLNWENSLKAAESKLFGAAMGVEGGCYIIQRALFPVIPPLFYMEDFFVSMNVLSKNVKVLFEPQAQCYEDISTQSNEEYKRKVRISIGNFQNLFHFSGLIFKKFWPVGLAFLCHKILRWLTPFLFILGFVSLFPLAFEHNIYRFALIFYLLFIILGTTGAVFSQNKSAGWLKYPGHFLHMNLALLQGFLIYLKGVNSNAWEPTRRNQE